MRNHNKNITVFVFFPKEVVKKNESVSPNGDLKKKT